MAKANNSPYAQGIHIDTGLAADGVDILQYMALKMNSSGLLEPLSVSDQDSDIFCISLDDLPAGAPAPRVVSYTKERMAEVPLLSAGNYAISPGDRVAHLAGGYFDKSYDMTTSQPSANGMFVATQPCPASVGAVILAVWAPSGAVGVNQAYGYDALGNVTIAAKQAPVAGNGRDAILKAGTSGDAKGGIASVLGGDGVDGGDARISAADSTTGDAGKALIEFGAQDPAFGADGEATFRRGRGGTDVLAIDDQGGIGYTRIFNPNPSAAFGVALLGSRNGDNVSAFGGTGWTASQDDATAGSGIARCVVNDEVQLSGINNGTVNYLAVRRLWSIDVEIIASQATIAPTGKNTVRLTGSTAVTTITPPTNFIGALDICSVNGCTVLGLAIASGKCARFVYDGATWYVQQT